MEALGLGVYSMAGGESSLNHSIVCFKDSFKDSSGMANLGAEGKLDERGDLTDVVVKVVSHCKGNRFWMRCKIERKANDGLCARVDTNKMKKNTNHDMMMVRDGLLKRSMSSGSSSDSYNLHTNRLLLMEKRDAVVVDFNVLQKIRVVIEYS
jgi:hypothetical protein